MPQGANLIASLLLPGSIGLAWHRFTLYLFAGFAVVLLVWFRFGRGPRRRRAFRRARRFLQTGAWREALEQVRTAQALTPLSPAWHDRLRLAEADCQDMAAAAAELDGDYEKALELLVQAAHLRQQPATEARRRIVDAMLTEVRRLFATTSGPDTSAVHSLIARLLLIESNCAEAYFWQGLCHLRDGNPELAQVALRTAHQATDGTFFDPPLYLGMLALRQGQAHEALRQLSAARRIEAASPFVSWQLGTAILHTRGDAAMALRALEKALGPAGLPQWIPHPDRVWIDGFPPPDQSFIPRLAVHLPFTCPFLGRDVAAMVRHACVIMAQVRYQLGQFAGAAELYHQLLQETAPTVEILRGLGLSLARLQRFDEAFKHLRLVHEQESGCDALTAGYLALCGARGRPSRPQDRTSNVAWAIHLLARYPVTGDLEWARINSEVFAEARSLTMVIDRADQERLVEVLASVHSCDILAAWAYAHLATTFPDALQPIHGWLFCRAVQQTGFRGPGDLDLLERAFADPTGLQAFFTAKGWDLDEARYTFLERWSERRPGRFPAVLGPDYPPEGERFLIERCRLQEEQGAIDQALAVAAVRARLSPHEPSAQDRLARLHYRRGELEPALAALGNWRALEPTNPLPLVRQAIIEGQRGHGPACAEAVNEALQRSHGPLRVRVAMIGARLMLAGSAVDQAASLLEQVRTEAGSNPAFLTLLAAVHELQGNRAGLASLAPSMNQPAVAEPRFHLLAAISHLAAGSMSEALAACHRAAADSALAVESGYLMGLALLQNGESEAASRALQRVAANPRSPSTDHARAWLGHLHFDRADYEDAFRWWSSLSATRQAQWGLVRLLPGVVYLAGLRAYRAALYGFAAEKLGEAQRLGWCQSGLQPLRQMALFKAGQRLLHTASNANGVAPDDGSPIPPPSDLDTAVTYLEQALQAGARFPEANYLLALAHKRRGNFREARRLLSQIRQPDAKAYPQMGILAFKDRQLSQAEQDFTHAWQLDPSRFENCRNLLLARLSLGRFEAVADLIPAAAALTSRPGARRLLGHLQTLLISIEKPTTDLAELTELEEHKLLKLIRSLGNLDTVERLLRTLQMARPESTPIREALFETRLLQAKQLLDRCDWSAAENVLRPMSQENGPNRTLQAASINLLGVCVSLGQDFRGGIRFFTAALKLAPSDARIQQNLALLYEWQDDLLQADPHWNRYVNWLNDRLPRPPGHPEYLDELAHEALIRLANHYSQNEVWASALVYLERAQSRRPRNTETLERLFTLYRQLGRNPEAENALEKLKKLRPDEPYLQFYALDLQPIRDVIDVEQLVDRIGQILAKHPDDARVRDRAAARINQIVPFMMQMAEQLSQQLSQVMRQVRHVPNYQVNWKSMRQVMRQIKNDLVRLGRVAGKCRTFASQPDQRDLITQLIRNIEAKIHACQRWERD